jgi:hypothetical protein
MTSRSDPGGRVAQASMMRRLYEAVCSATLIATAVAACIGVALLARTVLAAIWPG